MSEEQVKEIKEQDVCDNCGGNQQATSIHEKESWCFDCMRVAGYCLSCDRYLPDLIDDYYDYENDLCPDCEKMS